jgi:putative monooxygenase
LEALPRKVAVRDVIANRHRGGEIRVLLSPKTVGAASGFLGVLSLDPGDHVNEHYHPYSEEFLYVVRGRLTVRVDGEPVDLGAGEALLIPIDAKHRVQNLGDERAEAVFHLCPLAPRPELGHVDTEPPRAAGPAPRVG